jgi:transmembrane sensor
MKKNQTYHIDLITRYFAGETSGDDLLFLSEWLKADAGNRKIFDEYRRVWMQMNQVRLEETLDMDALWKDMETRMRFTDDRNLEPDQDFGDPVSGVRSSGSDGYSRIQYRKFLRLAAVILLLAVPSFLLFRYFNQPELKQMTASTNVVEGRLSDGSAVTLNAGATLEYPSSFSGSKRNVRLTGEAWFEVKHNDSKPFIIVSDKVRVEVLGTTFYVNTNAENGQMEVILNSGSVAVYYDDKPEDRVILSPGEKADVSLGQPYIGKDINTDQNYRSWMTKRFIYNNVPLKTIVTDLNRVYHANLRITTPVLSECLVTATFDHQTVESILNVLRATLDLRITNHGSWTGISGNKCN